MGLLGTVRPIRCCRAPARLRDVQLAPEKPQPLAQAFQAEPSSGRRRPGRRWAVVDATHHESGDAVTAVVVGTVGGLDLAVEADRATGPVAASIGKQLLYSAQDRVPAAGVGGLEGLHPGPGQVQIDLLAGLPFMGEDLLDVGPGGAGAVARTVVVQDGEDLAQLASGVSRQGVDAARDLADTPYIQVGAGLERAGVEGDQGEAVGEGVVHLAGDAGALLGAALGDARCVVRMRRASREAERSSSSRACRLTPSMTQTMQIGRVLTAYVVTNNSAPSPRLGLRSGDRPTPTVMATTTTGIVLAPLSMPITVAAT